jgi:hypothetical protein
MRVLPVALLLLGLAVIPWVSAVNTTAASSNVGCVDFDGAAVLIGGSFVQ